PALVPPAPGAAVADLVGPQRRRLHQDVDAVVRAGERLRAPLENVDRLFPARLLHEQALQRGERAEVGLVQLQYLAPSVDRVLGPPQRVAFELAELREQLLQLVTLDAAAPQLTDLDQPAQRLRQLFPGARALVVGGDRAKGVDVLRIDLQDLLPALQRVALARELLAPDAAQALVDRDAPVGIGRRDDLLVQDLGQLLPLLRHLVEIGEPRERDRVFAADVDDAAPELDRLGAVVERVCRDLRHARVAVGQPRFVLGDVDELLVDTVQLLPA